MNVQLVWDWRWHVGAKLRSGTFVPRQSSTNVLPSIVFDFNPKYEEWRNTVGGFSNRYSGTLQIAPRDILFRLCSTELQTDKFQQCAPEIHQTVLVGSRKVLHKAEKYFVSEKNNWLMLIFNGVLLWYREGKVRLEIYRYKVFLLFCLCEHWIVRLDKVHVYLETVSALACCGTLTSYLWSKCTAVLATEMNAIHEKWRFQMDGLSVQQNQGS